MSDIEVIKVSGLTQLIAEQILQGKRVSLTVTGSSMMPLFVDGRDSVVLKPISKVKKGEIVFFKRDSGEYVLHRVYKVKQNDVYVVGDNQTVLEKIDKSQIIAQVESFVRKKVKHDTREFWYRLYTFFVSRTLLRRPKLYRIFSKINRGKI